MGDVRAEDDLAGRRHVPTLRQGGLDCGVIVLSGVIGRDVIGEAKGHRLHRPGFGLHLNVWKGGGHATYLLDLVGGADGQHAATAERARAGRRDLDIGTVVGHATVEQGIELFGHRAHRHQRQDADHDAADGQDVSELAPRQISNDFHGSSLVNGCRLSRTRPGAQSQPSALPCDSRHAAG